MDRCTALIARVDRLLATEPAAVKDERGRRRHWTDAELDVIRQHTGTLPASEIVKLLPGRTISGVYQAQRKLGLTRSKPDLGPEFHEFIRARHALSWSDREIVDEWNRLHPDADNGGWGPIHREVVGVHRRAMGLPHNAWSDRQRDRVRAKTREQCAAAGVDSLGALRGKVLKDRVEAMGWPRDLQYREGQILSLIWDRGPLTKKDICEALGMPFRGARNTLGGNAPGGTYLATLIRRGLLVSLRRAVRTGRKGGNVDLYSLPLTIERRKVDRNELQGQWCFNPPPDRDAGPAGGGRSTPGIAPVDEGAARGDDRLDHRRRHHAGDEGPGRQGQGGGPPRGLVRDEPGAQADGDAEPAVSGDDRSKQLLRHAG